MLLDRKGDKLMGNVRNRIKYDDISTGEGKFNTMQDKSVYEVKYHYVTTEKLKANIIYENMLS